MTIGLSRATGVPIDSMGVSLSSPAPARLSDIDWRWALPRIAAVFIVTRLLVLAVAIAVETTQPPPPDGIRVDDRPVIGSLTAWDGTYYIGIAQDGYHADPDYGPDYAFYPGYPALVRATTLLTQGDTSLASVVAGNAAFFGALLVVYALSVRYLQPAQAVLSLWFLSLAPGAVAFAMSYSDALFLLLAASTFLAMEWRHPWLAGILLALTTLTRVPGILLGLPLLLMIIERSGPRPSRTWLPLLIAPIALAGLFAYFWWLTGDPLASVSAQSFWSASEAVEPTGSPNGELLFETDHGNENLALGLAPSWIVALWLGTLAFYVFLFVFFRHDRIRPAYTLVSILAVATVFLSGTLMSTPRFLAVAWPFDWVLAERSSRAGRAIVLVAFALSHVVLLWLAFTWQLAP